MPAFNYNPYNMLLGKIHQEQNNKICKICQEYPQTLAHPDKVIDNIIPLTQIKDNTFVERHTILFNGEEIGSFNIEIKIIGDDLVEL